MTCSICGGAYTGAGNHAHPFEGRCCDDCDNRWVTPARILRVDPGSALIPILREFARLGSRLAGTMEAAIETMRRAAEAPPR